jgi:hypothetical protein
MTLKRDIRRSGAVAPLVALLMVAMCVVISIVLEGGLMMSESRHAQAVADASAMAGACVLFQNYNTTQGVDPASVLAAYDIANDNGYDGLGDPNTANSTQVVAFNPPSSGLFKGQANYIEVFTTFYQGRYFSWVLTLWPINATLQNTMPINARAVAEGAWVVPNEGMLLLNASGPDLVTKGGGNASGGIDTNGNVIVNALNGQDITQTGNSSIVAGGVLAVSGNQTTLASQTQPASAYTAGGSGIYAGNGSSSVYTNQHPTPDPLAYLLPPGATAPAGQPQPPDIPGAAPPVLGPITLPDGTTNAYIAWPGRYGPGYQTLPPDQNGNTIIFMQGAYPKNPGNDIFNATVSSGIYYIDGGFSYRNAVIVMDNNQTIMDSTNTTVVWNGAKNYQGSTGGMMIFMNSGAFDLEGNPGGLVYLGNETGGPYSGMSVWQPTWNNTGDKVAGNGSYTITGTFYAPTALLTVDGNGGSSVSNTGNWQAGTQIGGNFIGLDVNVVGNGTQFVRTNPNGAKTRILTLVE